MTWLGILILTVGVPFCIWMIWDIWADYQEMHQPLPRCACNRRILRHGDPIFDHTDLQVHGMELCQPRREWVDD